MGAICRKIAAQPPETFREALQLLWLVHVIANIGGGSALSFARFDQYMVPFYRRDTERGALTRDEAKMLLSCMWHKVNEPKMRTVQSICLAGTTPDGECGANELTGLCLEVCGEVGQPYPNCSVRVSPDTPEWLWDQIVETMKLGIGHPMVLNDGAWVPNLERLGYPVEAARDYYNMGCVEMMIQGQTGLWAGAGSVDLAGVIELVFRNGQPNMAGATGPQTGALDSLTTFDQFLDAYIAQIEHQVGQCREAAERQADHRRGRWYDPFASALIDDCLEKGLDMYQGGSRFPPILPVNSRGIGTAADSLAAIKRIVFDEKRLSLQELWEVLQDDYEGHEGLRVELDRRMPCYGNDDDEADDIARRIFAAYTDAVHRQNDESAPGRFVTVMFSYTGHIFGGEVTAATPNGRRRGETISNGIDATQGKDIGGPTKLINSVTRLDHSRMTGACAFNLKLSPALVRGEAGTAALKALLKTYVAQGGCQIQVNFVDRETLLDAQEHPDRHRNLIVRVAGYSEYFNSLDRRLQDEVISRTAHGV
jgi:pyruvate-formate lyase